MTIPLSFNSAPSFPLREIFFARQPERFHSGGQRSRGRREINTTQLCKLNDKPLQMKQCFCVFCGN
jgi:hypothetical protein